MEQSALIPFVRENLDILFVGLNPAVKSSRNRHYFSVNQAFWSQLYKSGLISSVIDKMDADNVVFGSTSINYRGWGYGITDLSQQFAESDSKKITPTRDDCERLKNTICKLQPKTTILLHSKVYKYFLPFLGHPVPDANSGQLGKLIADCPTMFFNIAFPHGNTIKSEAKVREYRKVRQYLLEMDQRLK